MALISDQNVLGWRREKLLAAGFPYDHAHALATDSGVDLHQACHLAASAGHWLAWRILAASEDEPKPDREARIKEYLP